MSYIFDMQRFTRIFKFLFCVIFIICIFPSVVFAEESIIDTSHASEGYFSVYSDVDCSKMKVGVTFDKATTFYDYTSGETSSYAFAKGNGVYTITMYRYTGVGIKYRQVISETVVVALENSLSPYLVSTEEIKFTENDEVSVKAAEICCDKSDTYSKVMALCKFISENISYDYELAEKIINGTVKTYHPNACEILKNKKGICYDYAVLFAAMCRSQCIPCSVEKGYIGNSYHSWNRVYIDDKWYIVDFIIYYNNTLIT